MSSFIYNCIPGKTLLAGKTEFSYGQTAKVLKTERYKTTGVEIKNGTPSNAIFLLIQSLY
ncbi:hypothetical protein BWI97_11330 [Siphonobacter sp. BAB-5405]|nr:hypothetical protein BWI97_11330 [Siphonobacter sp. BAB-5405]